MDADHAIVLQIDATDYTFERGSDVCPEKPQYHQYPVKSRLPCEFLEDFKKARRTVRNAQDWAREKASEHKDALHAHVDARRKAATAVAPAPKLSPPMSSAGKGKQGRRS